MYWLIKDTLGHWDTRCMVHPVPVRILMPEPVGGEDSNNIIFCSYIVISKVEL